MITFVIGEKDSGKSELAETLAVESGFTNRYYIATMKVIDEEGEIRRKQHRKKREGKGFVTFEIPTLVSEAPDLMTDPAGSVVLLECMSNLVGNVMHDMGWMGRLTCADSESGDEFVRKMTEIITDLSKRVGHLIVVSSRSAREDTDDDETALYKDLLAAVNARLLRISDRVVEP